MPSRNNPNLPSSLNRRVLSHRRTKSRVRSATSGGSSRQEPTAPIRKSLSGVVRGRTVAPKKLQKMARNQNYALQRRNKLMAELPKARGEIEMTDTAPLSRRQHKLALRAAKVAEDNAKARAAVAAEKAEAADKAAAEAAEMEVDDEGV